MRLLDLSLVNFRNYASATLEFGDFNLIVGRNAQGKTNLLEAILFLATTKSHRASSDTELIRTGQEMSYVGGTIEDAFGSRHIEIANPAGKRKQVKLDGKAVERLSSLVGLLKVVLFAPETTAIVRGGPSERRRFLDLMVSQVRREYLHTLQQYQTALKERNEALKQHHVRGGSRRLLDMWDPALIESGSLLMRLRQEACEDLRPMVTDRHAYLTDGAEAGELQYAPNVPMHQDERTRRDEFAASLVAAVNADCARGSTSVGPHRDDLLLTIDGVDARRFGSQGQQRTLTLALKLAEFEWIRKASDDMAVVLLDDVTSELDEMRTALLFEALREMPPQVFLTTTDLDRVDVRGVGGTHVWHVHAGTIARSNR